nr:LysR substrate-binding domain-containing protein [Pseudomonas sp. TH03]
MVGTLISASTSLLPRAMQLLKKQAPGVLVSLRVGQMDQLFPALAVGEVDLVVGRVPDDWCWRNESPMLEVDVLYAEELSIVAGSDHPLHSGVPVSLGDLHPFPLGAADS